MHRYIKIFLMIALLGVVTLFAFSCAYNGKITDTTKEVSLEQTANEDPFTFSTVSKLKNAIKKNPKYYNNKEITIQGTVMTKNAELFLVDFDGSTISYMEEFHIRTNSELQMSIIVPDDILATVLETGDYVKLKGTVVIADGQMYLDGCEYTMLATKAERSQYFGE